MRCNKCGEKLRTGDSYCPICGEKYVEPEKVVPKSSKVYINVASLGRGMLIFFNVLIWSLCIFFALCPPSMVLHVFHSDYYILVGVVSFSIMIFWAFRLTIPMLDTMEVDHNGERIKVTRAWGKKEEYYTIDSISCVTDGLNTPANRYNIKRYLQVLNKDGRLLFRTFNSKDIRIFFEYYDINVRIYHGN